MTPVPGTIAATIRAFDRLAPRYDEACAGWIFRRMRDQVHAALGEAFEPGMRVLEIGCGSGLDAEFLASRGVDVVATDPSAGRIERARRRMRAARGAGRVQFVCCGIEEVHLHLAPGARFDGLVSDFGALNCVARLDALGSLAARHVAPRGRVILCLISPACLLELGWFLLKGQPRRAFRRFATPPVAVNVEGIDVPTYYHRVRDVRTALEPAFALRRVRGLAVLVPPSYLETRWTALPAPARRALAGVDRALASRWPFNRLGDHVMMEFENLRI